VTQLCLEPVVRLVWHSQSYSSNATGLFLQCGASCQYFMLPLFSVCTFVTDVKTNQRGRRMVFILSLVNKCNSSPIYLQHQSNLANYSNNHSECQRIQPVSTSLKPFPQILVCTRQGVRPLTITGRASQWIVPHSSHSNKNLSFLVCIIGSARGSA
jgi:hypothetical protein